MKSKPILLIEDTPSLRAIYSNILRNSGYAIDAAGSLREARDKMAGSDPDILLLDLLLPDGDGMSLLREIQEENRRTKVVIITANASINRAVEAMREGAFDFLLKPIEEQNLLNVIMNARAESRMPLTQSSVPLGGFIGSSPEMQKVYARIRNVAQSMATVFITGESGTGKELCAEAIHALSSRSDGPFVALNCSSIPPGFLQSDVFGAVDALPSGKMSAGAIARAEGGTLFLDEVCELDLSVQAMLLRLLQNSYGTPGQGDERQQMNCRIICATSRDPLEEVRRGRLRADLYYRLHVLPVHLPPLRERQNDVIEIAEAMLTRIAASETRRTPRLSADVREIFKNHAWPGNVRQLLNILWNLVVLSDGVTVTRATLPDEFMQQNLPTQGATDLNEDAALARLQDLTLAELERRVIEATIERFNGSVTAAARHLGVSPSTLYRKLESWGRPASRS